MLDSYRAIFALRGAPRFVISGALGRLPLAMTSLGIVLLVQARQGSYATAGIVAAAYTLMAAIFAPFQGRLADRYGQRPVLWTTTLIYTTGTLGILLAPSTLVVVGAAALAGTSSPQTGNFVRSRWAHLLRQDRDRLSTAFAVEAVIDEAVFIVGPVLVTFLTLSVAQDSGLITAAACAVVGGLSLGAQTATQPPLHEHRGEAREPLAVGLLVPLVIAAIGLGAAFGSMEVVVAAVAHHSEHSKLTGPLLAVWSIGSLIAGVVAGAHPAASLPVRRLRIGAALLTLSFVPMIFATNLWLLAVAMFLSGLTIAPTLITATSLVELVTPSSRMTEALTWTSTGIAVGIAPGAALSGYMADHADPHLAFIVPTVAAALTLLVALTYRGPHSTD